MTQDERLREAAPKLLAACRRAFELLTGETPEESYQWHPEAPYHFLWEAIAAATDLKPPLDSDA